MLSISIINKKFNNNKKKQIKKMKQIQTCFAYHHFIQVDEFDIY